MDSHNNIDQLEVRLSGISISPGVAFGHLHLIDPNLPASREVRIVDPTDVQQEVSKLEKAVEEVRNTIAGHVREYHKTAGRDFEEIIATHLLILDDLELRPGTRGRPLEQLDSRSMPRRRPC